MKSLKNFGRSAAQSKNVIVQKIREEERISYMMSIIPIRKTVFQALSAC